MEENESEALAVANRLRPVLLRLARRLRRELDDLSVTGTQISLLASLRRDPGIGLTDLAAQEGMSPPSLSIHIDRLEAAGLVTRTRAGGTDRRRVGLALTPEGASLLDTVRSRRTVWLAEGMELLDRDDLAAIDAAIDPLLRLLAVRT